MSESENGKVESKIYAQMGTLFLYLGLYEEAKRMFVQSYRCDSILKDSVGMIFNYRDIANCYRRQNQPDSALHYFRQADVWSRETGRTVMQRGIQSQLASLYLDNGVTDSAYAALSVALQNVERPDSSGIYTIAGRYYMQVNQPDSARWYYTQLLDFGNAYSKEAACEVLLDMAIQDGNLPLIKVYRPMQRRYADSVKQLTQTEAVYRVHSLFNYNRQEKKNARLEAENARYERNSALIGAISLLLIGVLMSIGLYQRRQQKILKRRLQQVNRLRKETGRQSDVAIEEYKRHIRDLEQRLADSEQESNTVREELQMERERYHAWIKQTEIIRKQREEAEQVFPDTVIFQTLKKKTQTIRRGEVKVTSQEWEALKTQIGLYYPSFFEKLDSLCYEFKENEIRINLLIKVGFNPTEIGILLGCSVQTISTWRRRLTERILNKEKAKPTDWDEFIRAL